MLKRLSSLLCSLLGFGFYCEAQLYPFVNYTPRDGLVGNKIRFISQDSKGKLYFGTTSGLSIYDGSRFTNYSAENGLFTNLVNGIVEAGNDSILIISNGNGLQYLHSGKIRNFPLADSFCPVINQLITCSNGLSYAMADEGLFLLENNRFSKIELGQLPGNNKAINLYHATELDSFLVINMPASNAAYAAPKLFIVYNYHTGKVLTNTAIPDVHYSIKTSHNELLLATAKGIFSLDAGALKKGEIKLLPPPAQYSIPPGTIVDYLYIDRQQSLWLNAVGAVMKIPPGGSPQLFSEQNGLPHDRASCIFQDREGIMWFGSDLTGVAKLVDQSLQFFKNYKDQFIINEIAVTPGSDSIWLFDHRHRLLLAHNNNLREYKILSPESLYWITMDQKGGYAAGDSSIYQLRFISEGIINVTPLYRSKTKEAFNGLLMDKNRNPIALSYSIVAVLPGKKIFRQPLDYYADDAVLKDDRLYVINRSMNLYIYHVNPDDPANYLQLVKRHSWSNENLQPRSIIIDSSDRLWIGTRQQGLFCYTITNGQLKLILQLTVKDGLTENFIRNLYCDATGHIWACSPTGLDKITLHNNGISIENITRASNMYPDMQKTVADNKGVVWAMATSGLLKVFPSIPQTSSIAPGIIFTKFTAANQELPLQQSTTLKHFQNSLFFQVAVPSFFDEKKTLFSYKLEEGGGNNSGWTEPSFRPDISFLNLPSGDYRLYVKAVFSNGKYAPLETVYPFTILTPWWQTGWFRGIILLIILLAIIFFFRLYYRSKLHQQRINLEKKQAVEKERTRIAIDMHDDMGAGLSRIKVLSETIKFENQKGIVNPAHLQKISVYSEEMMDKMGEIVWALNQRNDSLSDLLAYTRSYATDYLTNHAIHCSYHAPGQVEELFVSGEVRRNIFLSVKEALHNVVKHAEATHVDMVVKTGNEFSIMIHDNGKGIDPEKVRKFGNGLTNIRKRMAEIGGQVIFKNEKGTMVILNLPTLHQL